jgi:hypothetical protein
MGEGRRGTTGIPGLAGRLCDVILGMPQERHLKVLRYLGERQRRCERKELSMAAECESDGLLARVYVHDISTGGVSLQTSYSFDMGQRVTLRFLFRDGARLEIDGNVVRKRPKGVGIAFVRPTRDQERTLRSFIETLGT